MLGPLITLEMEPPWQHPIIKLRRTNAERAYHLTAERWSQGGGADLSWAEPERSLDPSEVEKLLALLRRTSIAVMPPEEGAGMGGTTYKVTIKPGANGANKISFSWWSRAPEPWEPVQLVAETLLRLVDKEVIAIEQAFYREGRTAPQVMSTLFSNLEVVENMIAKSRVKQLQGIGDQCRRLSEWFGMYSPSVCKQLARENRIFFNPRYWEYQFSRRGVKPDPAWLEEYRMACRKLNHSFCEVQLVDFE